MLKPLIHGVYYLLKRIILAVAYLIKRLSLTLAPQVRLFINFLADYLGMSPLLVTGIVVATILITLVLAIVLS